MPQRRSRVEDRYPDKDGYLGYSQKARLAGGAILVVAGVLVFVRTVDWGAGLIALCGAGLIAGEILLIWHDSR